MTDEPHLLIQRGDGVERLEPIESDRVEIGRESYCDIVIDEEKSSRTHCSVEKTGDGWKIVDLESRNGTKVNGEFMNKHLLEVGDRIEVGDTVLLFLTSPPSDTEHDTGPIVRPDREKQKSNVPKPSARKGPPEEEKKPRTDKSENAVNDTSWKTPPEKDELQPAVAPSAAAGSDRGKRIGEKKIKKTTRDPKRQDRDDSVNVRLWALLALVCISLLVIFGIRQCQHNQRSLSRKAYMRANDHFSKGNFSKALASYEKVTSSTPELQKKAKERKRWVNEARAKRRRIRRMYRAEKTFYALLDRMGSRPVSPDELEKAFDRFREKLEAELVPDASNRRLARLLKDLERARKRMLASLTASPSSADSSRLQWSQVREQVNIWRESDQYGRAVNRLTQFRYLTQDESYRQKAETLIEELTTGATLYVDRQVNRLESMVENGNTRDALNQYNELLKKIRSFHPDLHRLELDLLKHRRQTREKLDSN